MIELRPYQKDCVEAIRKSFGQFRAALVVMATGGGKTTIFADVAKRVHAKGGRTLILAHRKELIRQAARRIFDQTGLHPGVEMAGEEAHLLSPVVVASISTMRKDRLEKFPPDHFSMAVIDEAHHATSPAYRQIIDRFSSAKVLGVTATPNRADKKNLSEVFDDVAYELNLLDLTGMGYLAPVTVKGIPLAIDVSGVSMRGGDFSADELGDVLKPHLEATAKALKEHAVGRRTLIFWPLVATSEAFVEVAKSADLRVAHIDAKTQPDRRRHIMQQLADGVIDAVSNVGVLTEGVDIPHADCVLVMRPTKSQSLYAQMVGRGTRLYPGKADCLLLDPLFLHEDHDLMAPANLVATSPEHAEAMARFDGDLGNAAGYGAAKVEERLRAELAAKAKRDPVSRTLMEIADLFGVPGLSDYQPTMRWHSDLITPAQTIALAKMGISGIRTKGHAAAIMDASFKRREKGLCTFKQARQLRRFNHPHPDRATFKSASDFLNSKFNKIPAR